MHKFFLFKWLGIKQPTLKICEIKRIKMQGEGGVVKCDTQRELLILSLTWIQSLKERIEWQS